METFFQHSAALTLTTTSRDHSLGDVEKCGDVDREDWDVRSVWKCWEDWEAIRAEMSVFCWVGAGRWEPWVGWWKVGGMIGPNEVCFTPQPR